MAVVDETPKYVFPVGSPCDCGQSRHCQGQEGVAVPKARATNIRIDAEVYAAIVAVKAKLEAKTKRPQSLNAALRALLRLGGLGLGRR